jgi:DNA (cytosine-5)-methyltransferase 1
VSLRVLDLFSGGCGGWSLGLHRAGFVTVAACESDAERRAMFAENFPGVAVYDDVRTLTGERLTADGIGSIDVVAGSPPCQDASSANTKGKGIDGSETGLFLEALRIVREVRPRWVCFENSPRLRTRGVDRVLDELEQAGYTPWPLVVGADDAGAPHERKRMWLIAYAASVGCEAEGRRRRQDHFLRRDAEAVQLTHANRSGLWNESGWSGRQDGEGAPLAADDADHDRDGQLERAFDGEMAWVLAHPWAGGIARHLRVADGIPAGLARIYRKAYGDAVVPIIPEIIGRAILRAERVTA